MSETPPDQLTYEQAVEELKTITDELNDGLIDVDALTERFQRAIDIMEDLDGRIRRARAKVDELAPRLEALSRPTADGQVATPPAERLAAPGASPGYDYGDEPF